MTLQKAYENRPCVNLAEHQLLDLCTGVVIIITLSMSNTHAKCTYGECTSVPGVGLVSLGGG